MSDGKSETGTPDAVAEMLDHLVESGEATKMDGLDIDRLKAAMSAPGAAETVAEIQKMGADSEAGVGQSAPDFNLPYLPGQGLNEGETVRLSERFVSRPVALVFGSYS